MGSQGLVETISAMRDEELLRVVYLDSDQYRPEALTYAKAEIRHRGISFEEASLSSARRLMASLPLETLGRPIWKSRGLLAFGLGVMSGLSFFAWANLDSYTHMFREACYDCPVYFGYPFYLYQTGGFAGPTFLLWGGLIGDVAIAIGVSSTVGWLMKQSTSMLAR
jgi:hypothetical protein